MIKCPESITIYNVFDLKQEWEQTLNGEQEQITVNLTNLEDIDTAGAQLLLALKKECMNRKIVFVLSGIKEEIATFFKLIGCSELMNEEVLSE